MTIVSQYYAPDIAATGQLLDQLARRLCSLGFNVGVLTAHPSYGPPATRVTCASRERLGGVDVRRLWLPGFSKDRLAARCLAACLFVAQVAAWMIVGRSNRVYLYVSNPPILALIGALVSLVRRHSYVVLVHDLYPQVACHVGVLPPGGLLERIWHAANRLSFGRAQSIVVLCQGAKRLICDRYDIDPGRVEVIHNWADGERLHPRAKERSRFAQRHGLVAPFTLLYSGNLGRTHDFATVLDAANALRDTPFRLVFIGAGARQSWLERRIADLRLTNTEIMPFQPLEQLPDSLAACDAALVTIARGIEGISFPSKIYTALAVGRPIVAVCESPSEVRQLVEEHDVGVWAEVGDSQGLEQAIRALMADPTRRAAQGQNARRLFDASFSGKESGDKYAEILKRATRMAVRAAGGPVLDGCVGIERPSEPAKQPAPQGQ